MLHFDKKKFQQILMNELRYSENRAIHVLNQIRLFNHHLQPILEDWMKDRTFSDQAINGVTLELVYEYIQPVDFIAALIEMELFARNPDQAKRFLENPMLYIQKM